MPHDALPAAWSVCERCKQELQTIHIKYRWAMASLGKAYAGMIHEFKAQDAACTNDARNGDGRGKVSSEAMDVLLQSVSTAGAPKQPQAFKKRLHRALRWYEAAKQLGWGMLCFMPHDVISNLWVENKLQVSFWRVWLELVTKVNPIACKASRALNAYPSSDGLVGGPIRDKEMLCIEAEATAPPQATQITKVEDSDEDELEEDEEAKEVEAQR